MSDNANVLNGLFVDAIGSNDGLEKLGEVGGAYIQKKLRETSFARQILPPINVTRSDVTRSVNHDGFVKIVDIEPDSKAMAMNFLGEPDGRYVDGKRYEVPFYRIASEDFSKDETELMAYDYPITKVIEENSVKDIQTIEDYGFRRNVDAGIRTSGKHMNITGTAGKITKDALEELINMIDGDELKTDTLLMDQTTLNGILSWDHSLLGDDLIQKVTIEGYTYTTLLGRKVITSIKRRMFRKNAAFVDEGTQTVESVTGQAAAATITLASTEGLAAGDTLSITGGDNDGETRTILSVDSATQVTVNAALLAEAGAATYTFTAVGRPVIYGFTAPRFLGQFYVLNQTKFVIKKDYNLVTWRAWEDIAIGIGNQNSMAAVTLDT